MTILKQFAILSILATTVSAAKAQNPIINHQFSADPTARVFNGRIYLFPSHDIISPVEPEKKWFSMADYHVFSSDNLTDWTDHGVILSQEQVPWGNPKAYSMWAPDCVEKDGKYYFFFPDAPKPLATDKDARSHGFGIGVAIADHPYGPYKALPDNIKGIAGIDPCVLQASNGENVIFWGGGGLRMARLKDNLIELADEEMQNPTEAPNGMKFYGHAVEGLPEGFKEGPFAFERNGKFYLTYPWVRKENGTECLAYAMSDKPMGPYEYKGIIMKEHENGCWTNHHSIVEYKG
ncbi:MAG: family 43 glycosylhydrolase, partial [Prevotella sp.]|nr:family 43 glycosylhydrolase [Prevotella sp.]